MFAGLEPIREHASRRWTATVSFTLQAALVAAALVVPLLTPQNLPEALVPRRIFVPISPGEASAPPTQSAGHAGAISTVSALVVNRGATHVFSYSPSQSGSDAAQPSFLILGSGGGVVPGALGIGIVPVMPHEAAALNHMRVSAMMQGNLIRRVEPPYPVLAKQAGIQGTVLIKAVISREGAIERADVVSGHPLLAHAALEAVRQWKYRPYYLNGEPVEVETQVTVKFVLNR